MTEIAATVAMTTAVLIFRSADVCRPQNGQQCCPVRSDPKNARKRASGGWSTMGREEV